MSDDSNEASFDKGGKGSRVYMLRPIHYDLTMEPDLGNLQFRGTVKIEYGLIHCPINGLAALLTWR
jgi:hypothetical protein